MSQEMYNSAVISLLIKNLQNVEFEARKESVEIFSHVLRRQIGENWPGAVLLAAGTLLFIDVEYSGTRTPTVEYISTSDEILVSLVRGFENLTINHNTSAMLRCRHRQIDYDYFYHYVWPTSLQGMSAVRVVGKNSFVLGSFSRFLQVCWIFSVWCSRYNLGVLVEIYDFYLNYLFSRCFQL